MKFDELFVTIDTLSMKKNYQPVMIKTLLESPNYKSSTEQLISKLKEASKNPDKNWSMVVWDRINEQFQSKKKPNLYAKYSSLLLAIPSFSQGT